MRLADAEILDRLPPGSRMGPRGGEPIIVPFWKPAFKPKWLRLIGRNDGETGAWGNAPESEAGAMPQAPGDT